MNKKAIFIPGVAIATLFLIGIALTAFYFSEKKDDALIVGEIPLNIISTYEKGEKALFYLDVSSRYAASKAYSDIYTNNECGEYQEYSLWKYGSKECFPEFSLLYNKSFNSLLNEYFISYSEVIFPLDNYELSMKDGFLTGKAIRPLVIQPSTIQERDFTYTIYPDFKIKVSFSLQELEDITKKTKEILALCGEDSNCWKSKIGASWEMREEGKVFMFNVPVYEKKMLFALHFNPLVQ